MDCAADEGRTGGRPPALDSEKAQAVRISCPTTTATSARHTGPSRQPVCVRVGHKVPGIPARGDMQNSIYLDAPAHHTALHRVRWTHEHRGKC